MFIKFCASGVARRVDSLAGFSNQDLHPSPIEGVWLKVQPTNELNEHMCAWTGTAIYGHVALVDENGESIPESLIKQAGDAIVLSTIGLIEARVKAA